MAQSQGPVGHDELASHSPEACAVAGRVAAGLGHRAAMAAALPDPEEAGTPLPAGGSWVFWGTAFSLQEICLAPAVQSGQQAPREVAAQREVRRQRARASVRQQPIRPAMGAFPVAGDRHRLYSDHSSHLTMGLFAQAGPRLRKGAEANGSLAARPFGSICQRLAVRGPPVSPSAIRYGISTSLNLVSRHAHLIFHRPRLALVRPGYVGQLFDVAGQSFGGYRAGERRRVANCI
jgi:hypothetical protein